MATGISDEERMSILDQMRTENTSDMATIQPVEEKIDDVQEAFEVKIKKEPFFLRLFIWLKSILLNTNQKTVYNEYKLQEIAHNVQKDFPGIINYKQNLILSPFYEQLSELKAASDFFRPYLVSLDENDGSFYVFLGSFIMTAVNTEINTNVDPYSNPITPTIKPDTRTNLLHKLDDIFDTIPEGEKKRMYEAAKAVEWMKRFVKLPLARIMLQFRQEEMNDYTCPFELLSEEIDPLTMIMCSTIEIPNEFFEALYLFAMRNSKHAYDDDTGRDAGEFIEKANANLRLLQMFMSSIPIRSITCLIHVDYQWRTSVFSGGEDWFVKYKNTWKKIFERKWTAWESDCKKEAMLSKLKVNFNLDHFPEFPERPWEDLWGGTPFAYESTLGFLNWFMRERFSELELDLKTLLVQGAFNKKENYTSFSESFGAMVQLSISFQELERKLSPHGEAGAIFNKIQEEKSRTLQAQSKAEKMMREIESDVKTLIHRFGDNARLIDRILIGALGLAKDPRYDTVTNLNKLKDKNNAPFADKLDKIRIVIENAIEFVTELEQLDKKKERL